MSVIFDSLRHRASQEVRGRRADRTIRTDAVLNTLGFGRTRPPGRLLPLLGLWAVAAATLLIVWALWPRTAPSTDTAPVAGSAPAARPGVPAPRLPLPTPPVEQGSAAAAPTRGASAAPVREVAPHSGPAIQPAAHFSEGGRLPAGQARASAAVEPPSRQLFEQAFELHQRGALDAAAAAYRALLARNELDPRVHNNLGLLYREVGRHDLAIRELQRALVLNPHYLAARSNLGVALLGASRIDEAAAEFRRVLEEHPRSVDAMVNLALAEQRAGRPERAKETLLRALGLDPQSAAAHFNLAALYDGSGDAGRAVAHYRDFLRDAGLDHPHSSAARDRIAALGASR